MSWDFFSDSGLSAWAVSMATLKCLLLHIEEVEARTPMISRITTS